MAALTPRELQVLELIVRGETGKQIASNLGISLPTVKWHVAKIVRKLSARSRAEAVAIAVSRGYVRHHC